MCILCIKVRYKSQFSISRSSTASAISRTHLVTFMYVLAYFWILWQLLWLMASIILDTDSCVIEGNDLLFFAIILYNFFAEWCIISSFLWFDFFINLCLKPWLFLGIFYFFVTIFLSSGAFGICLRWYFVNNSYFKWVYNSSACFRLL